MEREAIIACWGELELTADHNIHIAKGQKSVGEHSVLDTDVSGSWFDVMRGNVRERLEKPLVQRLSDCQLVQGMPCIERRCPEVVTTRNDLRYG